MPKKMMFLLVIVAVAGIAGVLRHKIGRITPGASQKPERPAVPDKQTIRESQQGAEQPTESPRDVAQSSSVGSNTAKALPEKKGGETKTAPDSRIENNKQAEAEKLARKAENLSIEGRSAEALEYAEKAVTLDPLSPDALHALRNVYAELGRYSNALEVCEKSLEIPKLGTNKKPYLADLYHICLLELVGRQDEAIQRLKTASVEYPDAKLGPPFFVSAKTLLTDLETAKTKGLYSKHTVMFIFFFEFDKLSSADAIKLLEKHLPVFPEGEKGLRLLKEGKSVADILGETNPKKEDTQ